MKRIDELLEKYFAGTTSLPEEKELKAYFQNARIAPEHQKYKALFQAFETEKNVKATDAERKPTIKSTAFRKKWTIIISGAAAACLLTIFAARYQHASENYMIVRGKRINNPEMAREFGNAKLEKSLDIVRRSLASHKENELVREKLQEIEQQIKLNN